MAGTTAGAGCRGEPGSHRGCADTLAVAFLDTGKDVGTLGIVGAIDTEWSLCPRKTGSLKLAGAWEEEVASHGGVPSLLTFRNICGQQGCPLIGVPSDGVPVGRTGVAAVMVLCPGKDRLTACSWLTRRNKQFTAVPLGGLVR